IAILREQGVNSHLETAYAFDRAGFDAYDVHMSDLLSGRASLADFTGAVACGYVRCLLRTCRYVRAGHLQRLPNDEQSRIDDSGRRRVAQVHAQQVGAIRSAVL